MSFLPPLPRRTQVSLQKAICFPLSALLPYLPPRNVVGEPQILTTPFRSIFLWIPVYMIKSIFSLAKLAFVSLIPRPIPPLLTPQGCRDFPADRAVTKQGVSSCVSGCPCQACPLLCGNGIQDGTAEQSCPPPGTPPPSA